MNELDWTRLADLTDENIGPREEDVKFKIVIPLLKLLGFSEIDFSFETPSDLGRADITVKGFPVTVITECKGPGVRLEDFVSQVERYVRDTMTRQHAAMVSLLTNGKRFRVYGVIGAIHKNELADHLLFEFQRAQLKETDTQSELKKFLGRDAVSGHAGDIRASIESVLRVRREADQEKNNLIAQRAKLQEQMREIEHKLGNHESAYSRDNIDIVTSERNSGQAGFKWSKEYGSQEIVCSWISNCLEKLAPPSSTELISHTKLSQEFCAFLSNRGTDRAKSLTQSQRLRIAGNMIDWITAQWTLALGGKDSEAMQSNPGAKVNNQERPEWLREFTRVWARKQTGKWAFKRR